MICSYCPHLQSVLTFLTLEPYQYCKSHSTFSSSEPVMASSDQTPYVLANLNSPSSAGELPQELGHLFCSQNL